MTMTAASSQPRGGRRSGAVLVTGAGGEVGHGLITAMHESGRRDLVAIDIRKLEHDLRDRCQETFVGELSGPPASVRLPEDPSWTKAGQSPSQQQRDIEACYSFATSQIERDAQIDNDRLQNREDRNDVFGLAVATQGMERVEGRQHLLDLFGRHERPVNRRLDDRRRDRVDADVVIGELDGQVFHELVNPGIGRRVGR